MVVCGKDFYPIEYKESYKPDLHFLKIRSLLSLRKLQASKCTESWLVQTPQLRQCLLREGLLKACCYGRFWSLATFKAKNTIQGLTIAPGRAYSFVFMYIYTYLSAR